MVQYCYQGVRMLPNYEPKEKDIENAILRYLDARGIFVFKVNNVGVWDAKKQIFRLPRNPFIRKGVSDIIGMYKGTFLAIEVKTPKRRSRVTEEQQSFIDTIRFQGGIAFVATSIEDVQNVLEEYID